MNIQVTSEFWPQYLGLCSRSVPGSSHIQNGIKTSALLCSFVFYE